MDDPKKPKKINISLDDLLDVELNAEPKDKLVINIEDMPPGSASDNFYHRQSEPTYKQRRPPKRKRSKVLKLALIPLGLVILLLSFFLLSNLFFGSEPEVIALENPSFRPTDPATIITDPQTGAEMVAGEVVIIAREGSSADDINRIAASIGGKVIGSMTDLNIYQVEIPGKDFQSIDWAINQIEQEPVIEVVKPNYVPDLLNNAQKKPKDPQWTEWKENRRWGQEYINLPEAWTITTGSPKVKIGIIEMGFDLGHYELQHMQIISGNPKYDFIKKSENHGNMVAGIIGARANNSKGIAGVLWEADYYGFIIYSEMDLINAIREASKRGISIVNISLMFGGWENEGKDEFDQKIFDQLNAQFIWLVSNFPDIIFIQAAGNNPKVGVDKMPLASLAVEFDNVITVGSIKQEGDMVKEHTSGEGVSIAAPGFDIRSTKSTDLGSRLLPGLFDNTYETSSGTSFATPFVTGVAGLILSVAPDLSPGEVKRIIMETAKPHVFDGNQFPLGAGVVDAYAAVLRARGETPPDEEEEPEEEEEDDINPEETKLDEAKRKEIINFMEKATSNIVAFLPEFTDPNEISNDDLIFILLFNGITTSYWNEDDYITRFKGTDVQQAARLIFGSDFKNIIHGSVDSAIWEDSVQEYHVYAFGPESFTENHVISIKEESDGYVVDVVHLLYYYGDYDRPDETEVYDENDTLITVLKGNEKISDAKLKGLPFRRYILKKTNDGGFYITQSIRM